MTDHDPMLDGITRWDDGDYEVELEPVADGIYVLFSDLPALLAAAREDERGKWTIHQDRLLTVKTDGYEQGQRDEREACALVVEARGGYHSAAEFAAAIRAREEKS
jgi:hypothetical protein